MVRIFAFIILFFSISGCSISTNYLHEGMKGKKPVDVKSVRVYTGDLDVEYEIIGNIAVDLMGGGDAAVNFAKAEAAKLGANGLIFTRLTKLSSVAARTGVSAVAIYIK